MMDIIELSSDEEPTIPSAKQNEKRNNHCAKRQNNSNNINKQPKKRIKTESHQNANEDSVPSSSGESNAGNRSESKSESAVAFDKFITTCLKTDSSDSMKRIVEKKLKKYFNLAKPDYRNSGSLVTLLHRKEEAVKQKPNKIFIQIQEVVDELKAHQASKEGVKCSDNHIKKLCRALNAVFAKIKKLETKEVDWDAEGDSQYLALQRYRVRLIQIHNKILELEGQKQSAFKRKISLNVCQFPVMNKTLEKYVNAKGQFPDFQDVLEFMKKCYEDECLNVSQETIYAEAKSAFISIGEQLQKQRKSESWESLNYFLEDADETDPAEQSSELKAVLDKNQKEFGARIDECIDEFVRTEKSLKASKKEGSTSAKKTKDEESKGEEDTIEEGEGNDDDSAGEEEEDDDDEEEDDDDTEFGDAESESSIEELEKDAPSNSSLDKNESDIFKYCGPVSPPHAAEGCSTSRNIEAQVELVESSESEQEVDIDDDYDDDDDNEKEEEEVEGEKQLNMPSSNVTKDKKPDNCNSVSVKNICSIKYKPKNPPSSNPSCKSGDKKRTSEMQLKTKFTPLKLQKEAHTSSDSDEVILIDD